MHVKIYEVDFYMKVCHFTSAHPAKDIRIFIKESQSLAKAGHDVSLVVANAETEDEKGVHIIGVKSNIKGKLSRMLKTTVSVYKTALKQNADVYHFHDPELLPFGLLLRLKGKKVIYDVHEDVPRQILSKAWIPSALRGIISWSFEKFENFAAKRFSAIVGATPYITDRFADMGCYAVNINNYPVLSELYIPETNWSQKTKAVCYIGGINEIRGAKEMVEAIGKTNAKLFVGGKFSPPSLKENLMNTEGWKNVIDLGFVSREKVAETLSNSYSGLVLFHPKPNHINAQPNKMFEYMSAGIPVISSNFDLWKQIIEGNNCGICVNPLDPNAIAEAISWIMEHPEEAKQMGVNGRQAIEQQYNWEQESIKLVSLYKSI
jgi:glycosyltransferase involved in cell wall biosynthesis